MAKEKFSEAPIESIPKDEKILHQGLLQTMSLYGNKNRYTFRYALTDKGMWTKNKRFLFLKSKETFVPYSFFEGFKKMKYINNTCFVLYPKKGKASNRIFFQKPDEVIVFLDAYLKKLS